MSFLYKKFGQAHNTSYLVGEVGARLSRVYEFTTKPVLP